MGNCPVINKKSAGGPARGIVNRLVREVGPMSKLAPGFPVAAAALAPLRAKSEMAGSGDFTPLWAGQAARLSRELPAAQLTKQLAEEALEKLRLRQTMASAVGHSMLAKAAALAKVGISRSYFKMSDDPQQTAFWQKLPGKTVVRLVERYRLSITIRPDGRIVGLPADLKKLRLLLERWSKAKNKVQRSKKRRTRVELLRRSL